MTEEMFFIMFNKIKRLCKLVLSYVEDFVFFKSIKGVRVMVVKATFNNISFISWRSVLLVEETGVPRENYRPVASI
jgi:hypothetical protein